MKTKKELLKAKGQTVAEWAEKHIAPPKLNHLFDDAPWQYGILDAMSLRHEIAVEEFDRMTAQGYRLNFLTGEYFKP